MNDFDRLRSLIFKHAQYPKNPDKEYEEAESLFNTIIFKRAYEAFKILNEKAAISEERSDESVAKDGEGGERMIEELLKLMREYRQKYLD